MSLKRVVGLLAWRASSRTSCSLCFSLAFLRPFLSIFFVDCLVTLSSDLTWLPNRGTL